MHQQLGRNNFVLLGVGHTNAHVLRMWKMGKRPRNAELICVSDFPTATYSGMLPGVLAGQYPIEKMEIDLVRLAQSAGSRLVIGKVIDLDRKNRELVFEDRAPLAFDALVIGIGSRPSADGVDIAHPETMLAVKPMQTFMSRLRAKIESLSSNIDRPLKISVVGGGIGSIEIAFGLRKRFQIEDWGDAEIRLVTSSSHVGKGLYESTVSKIKKQFAAHQIAVSENSRVARIDEGKLILSGGSSIDADIVIWATNAKAHRLFDSFDLEKDDRGFILTNPTLQSVSDDRIFAVGDSGTIKDANLDKAGVYAVRQGPILTKNLEYILSGRTLERYVPQKNYLKIINVCDGTAISQHLGRSFHGRTQWWLKNRIDVKFMNMYQNYEPMKMKAPDLSQVEMRCLGCGGKVGGQTLSGVMERLEITSDENVIIGLDKPDDAAILRTSEKQVTVTTDFFAAPLSDPYIVGRIAALNSLSDLFVMGAQPTGALSIVQLPEGHPKAQSRMMFEMMAGAKREMDKAGAAIIGGHTIEGPRMVLGFTVLGNQIYDPSVKGSLKPGDQLVLSKPIGTGAMLVALMNSTLPGNDYVRLMDTMTQSNQIAMDLIGMDEVSAVTDVTGFGLAGHLLEMLESSKMGAEIDLASVRCIPGSEDLTDAGVESTLTPENRWREPLVHATGPIMEQAKYKLLFDPQTCGGLLLGVSANNVSKVIDKLADAGFADASVVGTVTDKHPGQMTIT